MITYNINAKPCRIIVTLLRPYNSAYNANTDSRATYDSDDRRAGTSGLASKSPQTVPKLTHDQQATAEGVSSECEIIHADCRLRSQRMPKGILMYDGRREQESSGRDGVAKKAYNVQDCEIDGET